MTQPIPALLNERIASAICSEFGVDVAHTPLVFTLAPGEGFIHGTDPDHPDTGSPLLDVPPEFAGTFRITIERIEP